MKNFILAILAFTFLLQLAACNKQSIAAKQAGEIEDRVEQDGASRLPYFAASNLRYRGVLFPGIINNLAVQHNLGKSIRLFCNNGTVDIYGQVTIVPESVGDLYLKITQLKNGVPGISLTEQFRVIEIPSPVIKLKQQSSSEISKEELNACSNFLCKQLAHFEHDLDYEIISLQGAVLRNHQEIHAWEQEGDELGDKLKSVFASLESGDQILIDQAVVSRVKQETTIGPFVYKVIN